MRTSLLRRAATRPLVGRAFATLRPALLGASSRAPLAPPRAPFALTELRRALSERSSMWKDPVLGFEPPGRPPELAQFFADPYEEDPELPPPGRRWRHAEIRLKSDEDLQKLWVVLLREKNMLHTARHWHSKRKTEMPHPDRLRRVRRSMAAIKRVLWEREREMQFARAARRAERRGLPPPEAVAAEAPAAPPKPARSAFRFVTKEELGRARPAPAPAQEEGADS